MSLIDTNIYDEDSANGSGPARLAARANADGTITPLVALDGAGDSAGLTDAQMRATPVPVSGFPATQPVSGPLTDTQLRAAPVAVSGPATDAQLRATPIPVSGFPATQPVSGPLTDTQLRATAVPINDAFAHGQVLADQVGAGAVLDFVFAAAQDLIWIRSDGAVSRCDPFGGVPAANLGIYCEDGVPVPITVLTAALKVFAPAGATVRVYGYRY